MVECIFKPKCCISKTHILYLWSPWIELLEEIYKDDIIKADHSSLEKYIENNDETNEPLFTKILQEFHVCLGCGYMLWQGCCSTYALAEINLLEAMHKEALQRIFCI